MNPNNPIRLPIEVTRPSVSPPIIAPPTSATPGETLRGVKMAVIDSVDNALFPQFATVLVDNHTPGEMGYAIPQGAGPFAAGGTTGFSYFYNNSQGVGGSICYVDCDSRVIVNFTGGVSSTPPTPFYKALADHNHNGQLDPDQFQNPAPVNLANGEISSLLPYGNQSPQVQGIVDSNGYLLANLFPGGLRQIPNGNYAGFYQVILQNNFIQKIKSVQPFYFATGMNLVMNWDVMNFPVWNLTNQSSFLDGWGPALFDSQGNYIWWQFYGSTDGGAGLIGSQINSWLANDTQTLNGPTFTVSGVTHDSQVHYSSLAVTSYSGGLAPHANAYIDGVFIQGGGSSSNWFSSGYVYPGYILRGTMYPPTQFFIKNFSLTTSVPHEQMSSAYQTNYDTGGNASTTKQFTANVQNVQPYVTDFQLHYSVGTSTPFVVTYWYDNGTTATDAKVYVAHDTSGASDKNIGHTTSGSPSGTYNTGLSVSGTVYAMAYYSLTTASMHWSWQNTPFTGAQIRNAYADGFVSLFATLTVSGSNSSAISVTSGGSGSRTGNGGKTTL